MTADRPTGRHVEALRACWLYPEGMRYGAHPTSMRALEELGYVVARIPPRARDRRWFLTATGKELLAAIGTGEAKDI